MFQPINNDYLSLYHSIEDSALKTDLDKIKSIFPMLFPSESNELNIDKIFNFCYSECCKIIAPKGQDNILINEFDIQFIKSPKNFYNLSLPISRNFKFTRAMLLEHCVLIAINTIKQLLYHKYLLNPRYAYIQLSPHIFSPLAQYGYTKKGNFKLLSIGSDSSNGNVKNYLDMLKDSSVKHLYNSCSPIPKSCYMGYNNYNFSLYLLSHSSKFIQTSKLNNKCNALKNYLSNVRYNFYFPSFDDSELVKLVRDYYIECARLVNDCFKNAPSILSDSPEEVAASLGYLQKSHLLFNASSQNFLYYLYKNNVCFQIQKKSDDEASNANDSPNYSVEDLLGDNYDPSYFDPELLYILVNNPFVCGSYGLDYLLSHTSHNIFNPNEIFFSWDDYIHNTLIFLPILERLFFFSLTQNYNIDLSKDNHHDNFHNLLDTLIAFVQQNNSNYHALVSQYEASYNKSLGKERTLIFPELFHFSPLNVWQLNAITAKPDYNSECEIADLQLRYTKALIPSFDAFFNPEKYNRFFMTYLTKPTQPYLKRYLTLAMDLLWKYPKTFPAPIPPLSIVNANATDG